MLSGHNLGENWRIVISDFSKKQLRRIPDKDSTTIYDVVQARLTEFVYFGHANY